ncbi:MAG: hypothetical protein OEY96_07630 [Gammaproteobacteria bacterium]|nr:hypothetical protein [Gammaproteobacteria bacterium]
MKIVNITINTLAKILPVSLLLAASYAHSVEFEAKGNVELQARVFVEDPLFPTQPDNNLSLATVPEFYWSWNDGDDLIEFVPSARIDQNDDERTHNDIRELAWIHASDNWETRIGIRRVFWGVTEFQHLVDIINQTDAVDDIDDEDKLGQPMINLSLVNDWGIVDFFVMPYFRERTFAGIEGRPMIPNINPDNALYESSDEDKHKDYAVRWSHSIDDYEVAVSLFKGTSRAPVLTFSPATLELSPFYFQIEQVGVELQANIEDLVWKLELINQDSAFDNFSAIQTGFEYSFYGVYDSNADLGLIMEYSWDERGEQASSNFQNDIFVGARLAMNDVDSSELLMGFGYDLDFGSNTFVVEASRRYGDNLKLSLDVRFFESDDVNDFLYFVRRDDHFQLTAQYYF